MAYITHYRFNFSPPSDNVVEVIEQFQKFDWSSDEGYHKRNLYDAWVNGTHITWYLHEVFIKKLSVQFPSIVFILEGRGENPYDIWVKYFKAGKMQKVVGKIVYDPFDEEKAE